MGMNEGGKGRLTVSGMGTEEGDGEAVLSHVPDTQSPVLAPGRHNVLLGRVFVDTVQGDVLSCPRQQTNSRWQKHLRQNLCL